MHELSIAYNLVEIAAQAAHDAHAQRIESVHLRIGALSGVVPDALHFGYEVACAGTVLEGSKLIIEELPVVVYCPKCDATSTLANPQAFCCGLCGEPTAEIRQGRELEIVSLEVLDEQPTHS